MAVLLYYTIQCHDAWTLTKAGLQLKAAEIDSEIKIEIIKKLKQPQERICKSK